MFLSRFKVKETLSDAFLYAGKVCLEENSLQMHFFGVPKFALLENALREAFALKCLKDFQQQLPG